MNPPAGSSPNCGRGVLGSRREYGAVRTPSSNSCGTQVLRSSAGTLAHVGRPILRKDPQRTQRDRRGHLCRGVVQLGHGMTSMLLSKMGLSKLLLLAVRGKVFLFENRAVMQFMPRDDVSQPAHADFILISDAAPHPGLSIEIAQQRKGSAAHGDKIFYRIG